MRALEFGGSLRTESQEQPHQFDALYNACAAGHCAGVRLFCDQPNQPRQNGKLTSIAHDKHQQRKWFDNQQWEEMSSRYFGE